MDVCDMKVCLDYSVPYSRDMLQSSLEYSVPNHRLNIYDKMDSLISSRAYTVDAACTNTADRTP